MVSDPIFRLGGRHLGHGTEPQSSVRTASESVPAYGGAKATRVAEDGYGVDRMRSLFLLGYWGTSGVLSRRVRMLAGNIHCVLFLGFAIVRRGFIFGYLGSDIAFLWAKVDALLGLDGWSRRSSQTDLMLQKGS